MLSHDGQNFIGEHDHAAHERLQREGRVRASLEGGLETQPFDRAPTEHHHLQIGRNVAARHQGAERLLLWNATVRVRRVLQQDRTFDFGIAAELIAEQLAGRIVEMNEVAEGARDARVLDQIVIHALDELAAPAIVGMQKGDEVAARGIEARVASGDDARLLSADVL